MQFSINLCDFRVLANYVTWHVVDSYTAYLPNQFNEANLIIKRQIEGVDTLSPRWSDCVQRTENVLPYVTGALWIEQYFTQEDKKEVSLT